MPTYLLVTGGLLFSIIALAWFPLPYLFIAACGLLICVRLFRNSQTTLKRSIWFNLAFTIVVLAALEIYAYASMYIKANTRFEDDVIEGYQRPDEFLGYAPVAGSTKRARKFFKNELVYDVTYTIGDDGHRITPPGKFPGSDQCIVFFGDSFTVGEGVNDSESMPWIVGTLQPYKVRNFGFHGYGPHQMLSAIEHGMVDCKPRFAIFQTLYFHVARSGGHVGWDRYGPKYALRDGRLVQAGPFHDRDSPIEQLKKFIAAELGKSFLEKKVLQSNIWVTDDDIQVYLQIVDTSRRKLAEQFPGVEFRVILWDWKYHKSTFLKIKQGFESLGIKFTLVSGILPGLIEDPDRYALGPYDRHPNALAHRLIAEYVVNHMLE